MFEMLLSRQYEGNQKQAQWQFAVSEAYTRFAQMYPEWSNALFDAHFLAQSAGTHLANWESAKALDAATLASAWDRQLGPASPAVCQNRIADLTPAAADFLKWATAAYQFEASQFVFAAPYAA